MPKFYPPPEMSNPPPKRERQSTDPLTMVFQELIRGAESKNLPIVDYIKLLITSRDWYELLSTNHREMISRAVNSTCKCGFWLPSSTARDPALHRADCPYRELFQEEK